MKRGEFSVICDICVIREICFDRSNVNLLLIGSNSADLCVLPVLFVENYCDVKHDGSVEK